MRYRDKTNGMAVEAIWYNGHNSRAISKAFGLTYSRVFGIAHFRSVDDSIYVSAKTWIVRNPKTNKLSVMNDKEFTERYDYGE